MDALSRADGMKVVFESGGGGAPTPAELRFRIKALDRPLFQYSYQIVDDRTGNGDGRVQKGEQVSMYLTVKNVGKGRSYETQANIANLSGDGLLLRAGRFDISNMAPGDPQGRLHLRRAAAARRERGDALARRRRSRPARVRHREGEDPDRGSAHGREDHRHKEGLRQRDAPARARRQRPRLRQALERSAARDHRQGGRLPQGRARPGPLRLRGREGRRRRERRREAPVRSTTSTRTRRPPSTSRPPRWPRAPTR